MRRRGRSPTERFRATNGIQQQYSDDDDSDISVLDTDDQEAIIRKLEQDAQQQSRLFQGIFSMFSMKILQRDKALGGRARDYSSEKSLD